MKRWLAAALLLLVSCATARTTSNCRIVSQVNVCDDGTRTGKPLVLLHGLGGSVKMWDGWLKTFEDYRVIRIDLPGHGKSAPSDDYSVEADAAVLREVLRQLSVKDFALAGHSLGGFRAWYLAQEDLTRPHVTDLILIAPIGLEPQPNWFDRIPRPLLSIGRLFLRDSWIDRVWPCRWWSDETGGLEDIEARTLILWGGNDPMRGRCCFDRRIRDSTLVIVPNAGHLLLKKPETVAAARKFLDGTLAAASPETCPEPCPASRQPCR